MSDNATSKKPEEDAGLSIIETRLVSTNFQSLNPVKVGPINLAENKLDSISQVSKKKKEIKVFLNYSATASEGETNLFKLAAVYYGSFKATDATTDEQLVNFAQANAPAIIFPLLRAAIATITLASGFPPLTLPIVNFLKNPSKVELID